MEDKLSCTFACLGQKAWALTANVSLSRSQRKTRCGEHRAERSLVSYSYTIIELLHNSILLAT